MTLSGSGAPGDPAVYTIAQGLVIKSTGAIRLTADLNDAADNANITFVFTGDNLQIEEGGYIETSLGNRSDTRSFILDLGGGSITGAGRIVGLRDGGDRNEPPPTSSSSRQWLLPIRSRQPVPPTQRRR